MKFWIPFLFAIPAFASIDQRDYERGDWDTLKARILTESSISVTAEREIAKLEQLKGLRHLCDDQLGRGRVPVSCFELLEAERKAGLLADAKWRRNLESIEAVCARALRRIDRLDSDQLSLHLPDSRCATEMRERIERLRYASVYSDPKGVFQARHRF